MIGKLHFFRDLFYQEIFELKIVGKEGRDKFTKPDNTKIKCDKEKRKVKRPNNLQKAISRRSNKYSWPQMHRHKCAEYGQ